MRSLSYKGEKSAKHRKQYVGFEGALSPETFITQGPIRILGTLFLSSKRFSDCNKLVMYC